MSINIKLPDNLFNSDEKQKLKALFRVKGNKGFLKTTEKVACAALKEYKEMFLGEGLPSRADEIQQHRLFHLIKFYFKGRLPTEAEISSMFQLTQSRSRTLLRLVMTRFHYDLEREIRNSLREAVKQADLNPAGTEYQVIIQSDNILEELNRIIAMRAPQLDPVTKVRNMSRTYAISEDSHDALCKYLGIK